MDKDNVEMMKRTGMMVCLSASPKAIMERASRESQRPLLKVADPKKQIELLLKLRQPYYALADKKIDTSYLSVKEVASRVLKLLPKNKK